MDKWIYACDTPGCFMMDGFIYLYVKHEDAIAFADMEHNMPICPVCGDPIRLIEIVKENDDES